MSIDVLPTFDAAEFRRKLAGLSDSTGGEGDLPESCKERSVDLVELIAICFNRDKLDAMTLWDRIESGIRKAIEECQPDDMAGVVNVCLSHVMAEPNKVVGNARSQELQDNLYGLQEDQSVAVVRYLSTHMYPCIRFGKQRWDASKEAKSNAKN